MSHSCTNGQLYRNGRGIGLDWIDACNTKLTIPSFIS